MTPFVIAILIMLCGALVGAILAWMYMEGRVEFWQDKFMMERRLKDKLLEQATELTNAQLRVFNDLRGVFKPKEDK